METNMVSVIGNTYPHRAALKAIGGRWDAGCKTWVVPATATDAVIALGLRVNAPAADPFAEFEDFARMSFGQREEICAAILAKSGAR